jgi:hypothetical protein
MNRSIRTSLIAALLLAALWGAGRYAATTVVPAA